MCMLCDKCCKMCGVVVLVLGVLFLLQDLAVWNFWNISWYTAAFILVGLGGFCKTSCPSCKAMVKKK